MNSGAKKSDDQLAPIRVESMKSEAVVKGADDDLPLVASEVESSKVIGGSDLLDEDRITAEIEDLQSKLGDLQTNIDKVLNEVREHFSR